MARVPLAGTDWIPGATGAREVASRWSSCTTRRSRAIATRCAFCSRSSGCRTSGVRSTSPTGRVGKELLGELNPALRVPTLVFDDGRALGESGAIVWYLADGHAVPARPIPGSARKVLQWMFFEQYSHEPHIAVARFWLHVARRTAERRRRLAEKLRLGYLALEALEQGPRPVTTSSSATRYSIADIALYAYTHVADEGGFDLERYPAIRAWFPRVAAQPGPRSDRRLTRFRQVAGVLRGVRAVPADSRGRCALAHSQQRAGAPPASRPTRSGSSGPAARRSRPARRRRPRRGAAIALSPTSRSSTASAQPCARTRSISSASAAGSVIVRGA